MSTFTVPVANRNQPEATIIPIYRKFIALAKTDFKIRLCDNYYFSNKINTVMDAIRDSEIIAHHCYTYVHV